MTHLFPIDLITCVMFQSGVFEHSEHFWALLFPPSQLFWNVLIRNVWLFAPPKSFLSVWTFNILSLQGVNLGVFTGCNVATKIFIWLQKIKFGCTIKFFWATERNILFYFSAFFSTFFPPFFFFTSGAPCTSSGSSNSKEALKTQVTEGCTFIPPDVIICSPHSPEEVERESEWIGASYTEICPF